MKPDQSRPDSPSSRTRFDGLLALRLGFALLLPALILAWTFFGAMGGESKPASSRPPTGNAAAARLYQAEQGSVTPSSTIEVYDPDKAVASTPTPIPLEERAALFDEVWRTVKQDYIAADFNGVDWQAMSDEYRQTALAAPDAQRFYGAIAQMVARLNDGRSTFTPPRNIPVPSDATGERGFANIGVTRTYDDHSLLVLYVYANGPAGKAGIQRRDRITAINGKPVAGAQDDLALSGIVGSKVTITVRSPGGQTRDLTLTREIVVGRAPVFSRQLSEDPTITYLAMPTLGAANVDVIGIYLLDKTYRQFLVQDIPLKGLVVDLRQTTGSSLAAMTLILGEVTDGKMGRFESRNPANNQDLDVPTGPMHNKYAGVPLVLLVDEGTRGDAEIMAAALQAQGRAKVVGVRTAGDTVSNETYQWPDGSVLSIAQWRFFLPDGSNLDGRGVTPDVTVSEDWTQGTGDSDPYIQAAVSLLHSMGRP